MDEAVALEFAADVAEAVASVRELSDNAQVLADTAKEAADGVAGLADPAAAAAEGTQALAESSTGAADGLREVSAAAGDAATAAGTYADAATGVTGANERVAESSATAAGAQDGAAGASEAAAASHGKLKLALVGTVAALALAVGGAASFQAQTTRLVTSAGELPGNLAMVQEGMLGISAATATSTSEMASGMYTVESAGFHGAAALTVLKSAAQGAKDEGAQLATVANGVTDALVDFHEPASAAATVTSQLIKAVSFGKTNFEEFSGSMSNVLPLASAMHLKLADVTGVLAEMTSHGMSALRASEDEANAMRSLMSPTSTMTAEYKKLGISANEVQAHLGKVGLSGTMQWLSQVAQEGAGKIGQNYTQALDKLMGTAPGLVVALMTTGKNAGDTTKAIKGIAGASADAKGNVDGFSKVQQTLAFKTQAAGESLKAAGITLGMALLPAVVAVVGPITHMLQLIAGNKVAADALAAVVGVVLAGALGGKLAGAFKDVKAGAEGVASGVETLMGKMGLLTVATEAQATASEAEAAAATEADAAMDANPIGLIIIAVIALVAAIYELVTHWRTVWHFIMSIVDDAVNWIKDHWKVIVAWLVDPMGMVVMLIRQHWKTIKHDFLEAVDAVIGYVRQHWPLILAILTGPIGLLVYFIREHWATIRHDTAAFADAVVDFFKKLPGRILHELAALPGQMLHAGESVIDGLIHGIESAASAIPGVMKGLASDVESFFTDPLKIMSPSQVFAEHGANVVLGIAEGIEATTPRVIASVDAMGAALRMAGVAAVQGLAAGMRSMDAEMMATVAELGALADQAIRDRMQISSPSRVMFDHGRNSILGYVLGMRSMAAQVQAAMHETLGGALPLGGASVAGAGGYGAYGGAGGHVNVTVPLSVAFEAGTGGLNSPQFLQYIQGIIQEAVLRYAINNPSSGLVLPGRMS